MQSVAHCPAVNARFIASGPYPPPGIWAPKSSGFCQCLAIRHVGFPCGNILSGPESARLLRQKKAAEGSRHSRLAGRQGHFGLVAGWRFMAGLPPRKAWRWPPVLRYVPFCVAERPVSHAKTARSSSSNGRFCRGLAHRSFGKGAGQYSRQQRRGALGTDER